jgi:hypothetical protein
MDEFLKHYLIAAIWSTTDDTGDNLDEFGVADFSAYALESARKDCEDFQNDNKELLALAYEFYNKSGMSSHPDAGSPEACAGHDFWLTRNHHGVGFWDRGMGGVGDLLTNASHHYGEKYVFVNEDNQLEMD